MSRREKSAAAGGKTRSGRKVADFVFSADVSAPVDASVLDYESVAAMSVVTPGAKRRRKATVADEKQVKVARDDGSSAAEKRRTMEARISRSAEVEQAPPKVRDYPSIFFEGDQSPGGTSLAQRVESVLKNEMDGILDRCGEDSDAGDSMKASINFTRMAPEALPARLTGCEVPNAHEMDFEETTKNLQNMRELMARYAEEDCEWDKAIEERDQKTFLNSDTADSSANKVDSDKYSPVMYGYKRNSVKGLLQLVDTLKSVVDGVVYHFNTHKGFLQDAKEVQAQLHDVFCASRFSNYPHIDNPKAAIAGIHSS